MATYTALQIVNRVRRRLHMSDASVLTDDLSKALLDFVNEAKDYVLETRNWDFDARHDGVIITQGIQTSTATTVTNGGTDATTVNFTTGDYVARILITDDEHTTHNQSQTAYRIVHESVGSIVMDAAYQGSSQVATAAATIFFAEYKLPDTVKDVLEVRFQDDNVTLHSCARDQSFSKYVPRLHDRFSDNPEIVVVGSTITPTYMTGGSASPGLGLLVYPPPENGYRLDYSYTVRHPQLSADQDLENVSDIVVHDIVLEAEALAYGSSVANDPDLEKRAHQFAEVRSARHHQVNTADPNRRSVLRSLDNKGGPRSGSRPADEDTFYTP